MICRFLDRELRDVGDSGRLGGSRGVGVGGESCRFEGLGQLVIKESINVAIDEWFRFSRDLSRGSVVSGNSKASISSRNSISVVVFAEGDGASVMLELDNVKFAVGDIFPGGQFKAHRPFAGVTYLALEVT